MSYQTKVYTKQGGNELVVASGGVLTIESGGAVNIAEGGAINDAQGSSVLCAELAVTNAQALDLTDTPLDLVAAPAAGFAIVPVALFLKHVYATGAFTVGGTSDLAVKYTNGSGAAMITMEMTGVLDQTSDQIRFQNAPATILTPVAAAKAVLHMTTADVTGGGGSLIVRFYYRVIPVA